MGRPDLSRNPLSHCYLGYIPEAPRDKTKPGYSRPNHTSDFHMVLTKQLQGVTMPAVASGQNAERQWRHLDVREQRLLFVPR